MKVTNAEILQAIWRAQVKRTAKGVIDNYFGGNKGLKGDSDQDRHYSQYLSMVSRGALGIPLSKGHLAYRLKALIGVGALQWFGRPGNAYEFRTDAATDVFHFARKWWEERGVPSGFDKQNQRSRTARIDDYENLAAQLERELLERFGSLEAAL